MKTKIKKFSIGAYAPGATNAGGKAVIDVHTFAGEIDFQPLMTGYNTRIRRALNQIASIFKLQRGSIVLVQYPVTRQNIVNLIRRIYGNNVYIIALVHDLPTFRYKKESFQVDINNLNSFDYIIVHNTSMEEILKKNGVHKKMITLDIFDYNYSGTINENRNKNEICFAGNLEKSKFIYRLTTIEEPVKFNLYGVGFNQDLFQQTPINVKYKGSVLADELPGKLEGGFGLIWDGDVIHTCSGVLGEYTRINNPHKLSLYLASNKPVIAWNHAAISDFIKKENVGFTVESLTEIPDKIKKLTDDQYNNYCSNVNRIGERLRSGYYTKRAIKIALKDSH